MIQAIRGELLEAGRYGGDQEKTMREFVNTTLGRNIQFMLADALPSDTRAEALVKRFRQWVFTCAQLNATAVASTPLRLYATRTTSQPKARTRGAAPRQLKRKDIDALQRRPGVANLAHVKAADDIEEIVDHPLLDMLAGVNEWYDGFEALELTSIYQDLTGSAYWHTPVNVALGVPTEFVVLPAQWVTPLPGKGDVLISGFRYGRYMDNRVTFDPTEIIWFKFPNPEDPLKGMGCVEAAVKSVDLFASYQDYEKALSDNRARPDMLIKYTKGNLNPKTRKTLEQDWNQTLGGVHNAGRVRVTDQDYDVEFLGFKPNEMANLRGRDWTLLEICNAFGVPVALLMAKDVNRANADAAFRKYMQFGITPRLRRLEQRLNAKLAGKYDTRLFLAFDNVVPENDELILRQRKSDLETGKRTVNEIRIEDGEDPVPWGEEPLVTAGTVPLSVSMQNATSPLAPPTSPEKQAADGVSITFLNRWFGWEVEDA